MAQRANRRTGRPLLLLAAARHSEVEPPAHKYKQRQHQGRPQEHLPVFITVDLEQVCGPQSLHHPLVGVPAIHVYHVE